MLISLLHLSVFIVNSYTLWYDYTYVNIPFPIKGHDKVPIEARYGFLTIWCLYTVKGFEKLPFKGRHGFLTIWCLVLQTIYFGIAFLNDVFGTNEISPKRAPLIRRVKDVVFSLAFPLAIYVTITFWGLYAFDKDLIFPESVEKEFPVWMNHVMHSLVSVFILIELVTFSRNYPTRNNGLLLLSVFNATYIVWVHVVKIMYDAWMYPVLEVLSVPLRILFFVFSLSIALFLYILGEKMNSLVWSSRVKQANKKIKQ